MGRYTEQYRQLYDEAEAARQDHGWYPGKGEATPRPLLEAIRLEAQAIAGREVEWLSIIPVLPSGEADVAHGWRESIGDRYRVRFNPAIVAGKIRRAHCSSCVVIHNHPNGDPHPSAADAEAISLLEAAGVKVLDHVIVGRSGAVQRGFSFRESG